MNKTITKEDLMALGYGPTVARKLIRQAKINLVNEGYNYYDNPRLGRVPLTSIEKILGLKLYTSNKELSFSMK
ncbi:DUF3173 family protein [Listeria costaricensis]|uniref:DUF3173 family protein n=1 Tax=Listeria costaricensis TaxID=2026604 RepID=UPI000C07947F|nr:DUF3173 family protein [Listeria costaricensis]